MIVQRLGEHDRHPCQRRTGLSLRVALRSRVPLRPTACRRRFTTSPRTHLVSATCPRGPPRTAPCLGPGPAPRRFGPARPSGPTPCSPEWHTRARASVPACSGPTIRYRHRTSQGHAASGVSQAPALALQAWAADSSRRSAPRQDPPRPRTAVATAEGFVSGAYNGNFLADHLRRLLAFAGPSLTSLTASPSRPLSPARVPLPFFADTPPSWLQLGLQSACPPVTLRPRHDWIARCRQPPRRLCRRRLAALQIAGCWPSVVGHRTAPGTWPPSAPTGAPGSGPAVKVNRRDRSRVVTANRARKRTAPEDRHQGLPTYVGDVDHSCLVSVALRSFGRLSRSSQVSHKGSICDAP